jgi:hypothetical protein
VACVFVAVDQAPGELPLKYVKKDAVLLEKSFRGLGVPEMNLFHLANEEATQEGVTKLLGELSERVAPNDVVFVFFLGHGIGGRREDSSLVLFDGPMPVEQLLERLGTVKAGKLILVMDACRSGSPGRPSFVVDSDSLRRMGGGLGWLSAARSEQTAWEPDTLGHGVFSYALARILAHPEQFDTNADGYLSLEEVGEAVMKEVVKQTSLGLREMPRLQEPDYGTIGWSRHTKLLPIPKKWVVEVLDPAQRAPVRVRFPQAEIKPDQHLWLIVEPVSAPGQCYPQHQAILEVSRGPTIESMVYLGASAADIGGSFDVLLVLAGPELHLDLSRFRILPRDALPRYSIRSRVTVQRKR